MQNIFNKIAKISSVQKPKLSRKVSMSAMSKMNELQQKGESLRTEMDDSLNEYYKKIFDAKEVFKTITSKYDDLEMVVEELSSFLEDFENRFEEIGVEIDLDGIPEYREASAFINRHEDIVAEWFEANRINEKIEFQ